MPSTDTAKSASPSRATLGLTGQPCETKGGSRRGGGFCSVGGWHDRLPAPFDGSRSRLLVREHPMTREPDTIHACNGTRAQFAEHFLRGNSCEMCRSCPRRKGRLCV